MGYLIRRCVQRPRRLVAMTKPSVPLVTLPAEAEDFLVLVRGDLPTLKAQVLFGRPIGSRRRQETVQDNVNVQLEALQQKGAWRKRQRRIYELRPYKLQARSRIP